jgi:thiol-disulfide isomerase/thioredoxin
MVPSDELTDDGRGARWHKRLLVLVPGVILIGLLAFGFLTEADKGGPERLPDFELPLVGGGTLSSEELEGTPTVVNFWASWCGPCRAEAPALQAAAERYEDDGVRFLGVVVQDSELGAQEFVEEFGLTYDSVLDTDSDLCDELFSCVGLPRTYFVRADGSLVGQSSGTKVGTARGTEILGPITEEELDERVADLLDDAASDQ